MRDLLAPYGIDATSAGEIGLTEPEELGMTFRDNAHIKAEAAAKATGLPAFADDSGLVVDALDGAPGIHSARWAGPERDFARAMETIEEKLRERGATTPERRKAHFVSALCVAWPDGHVEEFEGRVDGTLVWPPRGDQGFGYDPMFLPDGHTRTFGEMPSDEKHGLPPRGKGLVPPRARLPQAGGGVPWPELRTPLRSWGRKIRLSASMCTGRSACRNAPIATSTATSATPPSTSRVSCAHSPPRSRRPQRACRAATVSTIFFGGGTPSLMQPATVAAVLDAIARHWSVAADVEVTLEANPTSVEAARFRGYRLAGVNRVSLGVQALDDRVLAELGRRHSAREALDAVAVARSVFDRYSFDLIYARPQQTPRDWASELKHALGEAGEHLSLYQLTVEAETPFAALHAAGKLKIPDEDTARALYDTTQEICAAHGLPAYEISNHARPGGESRHNLIYWRAQEYAGVGPGAHGRLNIGRLDIDGARHAVATEKRPEAWLARVEMNGHGVIADDVLTREEIADEFLLMGLRLAEGIDPARYAALAGRTLDPARIATLREHGLVETTAAGRLRVSMPGFPVLDAVVADLAA